MRGETYEYKVIPFVAVVKTGFFSKDNAFTIAQQLESTIKENAIEGWEFYRVDQVQVLAKPGCIGSIIGKEASVIPYDLVTFRRTKA